MVTMHGSPDWNDTAAPTRGSSSWTGHSGSDIAARGFAFPSQSLTWDATGDRDGDTGREKSPVNREDVPDRSAEHREDE